MEAVLVLLLLVVGAASALALAAASSSADDRQHGVHRVVVASGSMEPTLPAGSTLEADFDAFDDRAPAVGDIVVYHPPRGAGEPPPDGDAFPCRARRRPGQMCARPRRGLLAARFLERVVGVAGDRLSLRHGRLVRNGRRVDEPFVSVRRCGQGVRCTFREPITVPPGHFFVLGDARGQSYDSRYWGPVPRRAFLARVIRCTTGTGGRCGDPPASRRSRS